jgi:hypothetical protein
MRAGMVLQSEGRESDVCSPFSSYCLFPIACGPLGALRYPDAVRVQGRVPRVTTVIELTNFSVYRVWRSLLILTFASCYIMWGTSSHSLVALFLLAGICNSMYGVSRTTLHRIQGTLHTFSPLPLRLSYSMPCLALILLNPAITFLAQWHPLIRPKMNTFRGSADWSGANLAE